VRALFVMHDPVSPTGPVADYLRRRGFSVDEVLVVDAQNFRTPNIPFEFPELDQYDLIVPMGAPWGAWDDACIGRWLLPEIAWVQDAIARDIPVLGICFGGQLIARALGGTIARAPKSEIGWAAIHSDDTSLIPSGPWFQFHYDRWSVPEGAREIARNSAASQAFSYGRSLAVQFHPELTAATLEGWLDEGGREQVRDDGQDPDALLAHTKAEEGAAGLRTITLLDAYLERVAGL
jgi:GMP synthase-like glutamine amidotransferase